MATVVLFEGGGIRPLQVVVNRVLSHLHVSVLQPSGDQLGPLRRVDVGVVQVARDREQGLVESPVFERRVRRCRHGDAQTAEGERREREPAVTVEVAGGEVAVGPGGLAVGPPVDVVHGSNSSNTSASS